MKVYRSFWIALYLLYLPVYKMILDTKQFPSQPPPLFMEKFMGKNNDNFMDCTPKTLWGNAMM
jgi:hypothetical protein